MGGKLKMRDSSPVRSAHASGRVARPGRISGEIARVQIAAASNACKLDMRSWRLGLVS